MNRWKEEDPFHFWRFSLLSFQIYWTWYDGNMIFTLCRMITWVVFLRMFWNFFSSLPVKREGSLKVKTVKNERDAPLFTGKLLIKFQNILRNTTQVIIRHRVKILFSVISSPIFWRFSLLPFLSYWAWYDGKFDFYSVSYDNLSSVSQNVLKFYQQLTSEEL
jgi:hypothetical protein